MLEKPTNEVIDRITRDHLEHIYQSAQGKVLELSAVPTATAPLLSDGERGVYANVLYERVGNNINVITPTSTIVVT